MAKNDFSALKGWIGSKVRITDVRGVTETLYLTGADERGVYLERRFPHKTIFRFMSWADIRGWDVSVVGDEKGSKDKGEKKGDKGKDKKGEKKGKGKDEKKAAKKDDKKDDEDDDEDGDDDDDDDDED